MKCCPATCNLSIASGWGGGWDAETARRLTRLRRSLLYILAWASSPKFPGILDGTGVEVDWVDHFDERFEDFWRRTAPQLGLGLCKDAHYLNWRYFEAPSKAYQVCAVWKSRTVMGYMALQQHGASMNICELEALPGEKAVLESLLQSAMDLARARHCLVLNIWMKPSHPAHQAVQRAGFVDRTRLHRFANRFAPLAAGLYRVILYAQHLPEDRKKKLISDASDWSLSMGDSDLV